MRVFSALAVLIFFVSSAPAFAQGLIKTVAGDAVNGSAGFSGDGGPATSARLFEPYGAIVDGAGNIYLADTRNNRIRKVTGSTGIISTYAGTAAKGFAGDNGPATSALLNQPTGVTIDASGNLYIADQLNNRVRKVTPAGTITTVVRTRSIKVRGARRRAQRSAIPAAWRSTVPEISTCRIPATMRCAR